MKKFIGVIGKRNAGKSTVIVSLTGCKTRSYRNFVTDLSTDKNVYVIASSPQGRSLSLREFQKILIKVKRDGNCLGLVVAIQPIKPRLRLSLEIMIREVQRTNSFDSYLFILEPVRKGSKRDKSTLQAVNNHLRNSGLVPHILDGRKFAFVNAREINQKSKLFL